MSSARHAPARHRTTTRRPGHTPASTGGARPRPTNRTTGPAPRPRRPTPSAVALGAVGTVVLLAVVLLVLGMVGSSGRPSGASSARGDGRSPGDAALVARVTGAGAATADQVGVPGSVVLPKVLTGEPLLTAGSKPAALYIGAEFCPYCAADMWSIVIAFSRFGTFSGLQLTTSSAWDVHPSTATFSFHGTTYTSDLLAFETVEAATTDTAGAGSHRPLETPTAAQDELWARYGARLGAGQSFPFLDIGNRVFLLGAGFDPSLLSGLDQEAVAAKLADPADPVTQGVVGSANTITAAICSVTAGRPADVCNAPGTAAAARAMGLS